MNKNFYVGKKEQMSNNSTKYGYSMDGICVKQGDGSYRSVNGTAVHTAVSTDASVIVKECVFLKDVRVGAVVILDTVPFKVLGISEINGTTKSFKLLNLYNGDIGESVIDVEDKAVGILHDTLKDPTKAIESAAASISTNEFTPAQLFALANGSTTLAELREPKTVESLEGILGKMVREVIAQAAPAQ